ncbi:MAG: NAD-dependent epimerase/dehydratase family protein [Flavobacteriaceae bacterium]|nr:NAD-dependent epimerase/dehydratase family protein [Flavobacteriaceae bacterium]
MVLVTGATGILGRVLVLELLKKGKRVRATKRASSNLDEVKDSLKFYTENAGECFQKIEWVDIDLEDLDSLRNALDGVEEVYHCLARVSFHPKNKSEMLKTSVEGTKNLLYIVEEKQIKKLLFVSSIIALDKTNENGEIDENSEFDSKKEHSGYALAKYLSEMEVWRASAEGMNVVIVNPGVIIGTGNWGKSSGEMFPNFEKNPFIFEGSLAYVDVRDVAKISVELMEKEKFGQRYILISENKKYKEVADSVRRFLGKSETIIIPKFLLQIGYVFNLLLGWLFPILRMINKTNIEAVTTSTSYSNEKIKKELDYEFIPFEESIDFHLRNYIESKK